MQSSKNKIAWATAQLLTGRILTTLIEHSTLLKDKEQVLQERFTSLLACPKQYLDSLKWSKAHQGKVP